MLEDALLLLASPAAAKVETVAVVPSAEALTQLHVLLGDVSQPHVRHRAFMLLRRLGNLPPTLFRVMEEDETVALGTPPAPSVAVLLSLSGLRLSHETSVWPDLPWS